MEPTIRAVTCPCCRNFLFALEQDLSRGSAEWKITKDSPALQSDGEGNFMKCRHCAKRIALELLAGGGTERWAAAAHQDCKRILP